MAIDKLIPQYLNSDTDQKLVKSVEMTDNLNIRVSDDGEGTKGVVKNVKGTDVVSPRNANDTFPAGENRVIGSVSNEKNREILFLLWNINNNHGIYRLDTTSGKYQKLYQDSVLNFQKFSYVDCDVVIKEDEETLFYFTDNVNPPMKVNINRLMTGNYPASLYSGTNEEKILNITVAKKAPLSAPTYNIVNNPSFSSNNISDKLFQFAYTYKYNDGEITSLSDYSTVTVSVSQLKDGLVEDSAVDFFNQVDVYVKNTTLDVEKITLYARQGNTGVFYEVKEINNNSTLGISTIQFRNDKLTSALSKNEENKSFSNVPQLAKAQSIVNSRLMYGNYTEGYANTDLDVDSSLAHREKPQIYSLPAKVSAFSAVKFRSITDSSNSVFDISIDFTSLPDTVKSGSTVYIDFTLVTSALTVQPTSGNYDILNVSYEIPESLTGQIGNSSKVTKLTLDTYVLPISAVHFKKEIKFTSDTLKNNAIEEIALSLINEVYPSVIDADTGDIEQCFDITQKSKIWVGGVAKFKLQRNNDIRTQTGFEVFNIRFAGAEIFAKKLTVEIPPTQHANVSILNVEVEVKITRSTTLPIGGLYFTSGGLVYDFNAVNTNTYTGEAAHNIAGFSGSSSYLSESLNGYKSFKENATHSFGVVYSDDYGRAGGVNKFDSVYVPKISSTVAKGGTQVDFRIKNTAPSWASRWKLVYALNSSYNNFIQYSVKNAVPSKEPVSERMYISMTTLEGKSNSYKENTGAQIEYKYEKGDRLRVLKYVESSVNIYPENHEFNVIGYEFISDANEAPFLNQPGYEEASTGWFIILENKDIENFDYKSVLNRNDFWGNQLLVEIYSPSKEVEEKVYYEMGKSYDVVNGLHYGDRTTVSQPSVSLTVLNTNAITSSERLYINDSLTIDNIVVTIILVTIKVDGTYEYQYDSNLVSLIPGNYTALVNNYQEAVVTATQGDVYHRARKIRKHSNEFDGLFLDERFDSNVYAYDIDFIEDYSVSDFFSSKSISIGKPYAHIPDAKTIRRRSSITYSDAYVIDSDVLNLSSFNLSLANWIDLDILYGSVQSMINRGDSLTVIQESKASQVPVSRNLLEYANGDTGVSVSTNVLSIPSYYAGDYGTQNPESVIERFGVVYYVDASAGKILRLSANGITPISEKEMDGLFEGILKDVTLNSENKRVIGGFDPDNAEYLVTIEPSSSATVTIGTSVNTVPVDSVGDISLGSIFYSANTVLPNTLNIDWNVYCGNWDEAGNGIIYLDQLSTSQGVLIDDELNGSSATINVIVTDNAYSFIAVATLNLSTGKLTLPATDCEGTSITLSSTDATENGLTISYKHFDGVWGSKYSFKPTSYVDINNDLYSFSNASSGLMWKHNVNETRNNFYGTQYSSVVEVVSNYNPSMVKVFEAMGVEGTGTWSGVLSTSDQSTTLSTSDFDLREGNTYAMIPRDTLVSTSNQIYIGKVISVSGDKITFTTPVNKIPFVVGDTLKTVTGSVITDSGMIISGITERNVIQCTTTVSNIAIGDNILVQHDARVDGDAMRDVFLKINLTSLDTTPFEVHAVSVSYDRSRLHNDRVN